MRVSTFPTLHGERRWCGCSAARALSRLDDLGLPEDVRGPLEKLLGETSGAIIVSGPAGSGKTTMLYACLRSRPWQRRPAQFGLHRRPDRSGCRGRGRVAGPRRRRARSGRRAAIPHAARPRGHHGRRGPRSPYRRSGPASLAHRPPGPQHLPCRQRRRNLLRLLDMGIEPYALRSGLLAILNQRLLRRLIPAPRRPPTPTPAWDSPLRERKSPAAARPATGPATRADFSWSRC